MKHLILSTMLAFCTVLKASDEPQFTVSAGIGAPNLTLALFNIFDNGSNQFTKRGSGPLHFKAEKRMNKLLGLGLNINYVSYDIRYVDKVLDQTQGTIREVNARIQGSNTAFNCRANLYFTDPENNPQLDVYWGMGLGLKFGGPKISSDFEGYSPSIKLPAFNKIGFESTIGLRYFPIENFGIYAELGIAKSIVQGGLVVKI